MTAIAKQVEDFLSTSAPFDMLNESQRNDLIRHADLIYVTEDNTKHLATSNPRLYLIQSGQFSIEDGEGTARHLSEGDYFNYAAILDKRTYPLSVHVDSPGLVYSFAAEDLLPLLELVEVNSFFTGLRNNALQNNAIADSNSMWLYKSLTNSRTLFDAMALMTENNIHHLPVIDHLSQSPVGMVTASDIIRHQRGNVLFIIGELTKANNLYELTRLSWQLPHYFAAHAKRAGDYDIAGKILSQATDVMTRKLIGFFQQDNGKAPMMFAWLVYGSQAREDQTTGSDQDSGLLLASTPNEKQAAYFADMTDYVCKGLAKCGIKLCDGNIMASNPELRLSVDEAVKEAERWVASPTNKAIMHFNIFLDVRCAAGDTSLFKQLQKRRGPLLQQKMFLAALARNSNSVSVPLSMFQKFSYEKGRKQKDTIDLKTRAVALINNIARIYALADGITLPNTVARLESLSDSSELSSKDAANLKDIWIFLNRLRWRHQLDNKVTDNHVSVSMLSSIQKHQLKAGFKAIERANEAMIMKFSGGVG